MQYSFTAVALLAFVGLSQAQIPACATSCIDNAVTAVTTCSVSDLTCQCAPANNALIQSDATSCVLAACGATEALSVLAAASSACASVLAATSAPVVATSSSVPATSAPPTTAAPVSSSTGSSAAAVVYTSASTSASTSAAAASLSTSTTVAQSSTTPSKNATVTTTSPPIQVTGAAAQVMVGAGSIAALGMALLAAL
jgi:hypothetical protein